MSTRAGSFLVGLVGEGVLPSLTPPMHEREGDRQGLRYLYRPLDLLETGLPAGSIGELLRWAADLGFNGLNITHPCKQLVMAHLDEVSEDARRLAAVNTVVIQDGRFIGHNTDFSGFARALADGLPGASLQRVVQLGAGGAGSAVAYALLTAGVGVLDLVDTDPVRCAERAESTPGCRWIRRCWNPGTGWRTSSTVHSRPNSCDGPGPSAAASWTGAAWRWGRPPTPSGSSPAATPTPAACANTSWS